MAQLHLTEEWDKVFPKSEKVTHRTDNCLQRSLRNGEKRIKIVKEGEKMAQLHLTEEWDKVFPKSEKVTHRKVTFHNRYGITLAADLYEPIHADGKLPAIAVCGPFGAVKEQASGLYVQTMAERGFLTMAFDPSFTGESGGESRYMASPDINTEDFQAAVDFLSVQENVDPEKIGIIGICGWGGMGYLRLGWYGTECSSNRYQNQGNGDCNYV